jgi:hypothetical protein
MDTTRIKIKIGDHEFEAEGPSDVVQSQFDAFKEMITAVPRQEAPGSPKEERQTMSNKTFSGSTAEFDLDKIMRSQGRVISLTAIPAATDDAALLIMLGQNVLRNNSSVTGQEIGDGLAQSGRPVPRVDRLLDKAIEQALILKTGLKRGTRYRLTNQGHSKAVGVAKDLLASLP